MGRFIILLSVVALIQAEGSGNEFPTDPPLHPFESLGILTRIFIYLGILLVGLTLVIAALSCFVCSCVLYKRGWRNTGDYPTKVHSTGSGSRGLEDDTYSSTSFSFRSHHSTKTPATAIEGIPNEHFDHGKETSSPQPPVPATISSTGDTGGVLHVPSAILKSGGSTRSNKSNPEETLNASNRVASSRTRSSTISGAVRYESAL